LGFSKKIAALADEWWKLEQILKTAKRVVFIDILFSWPKVAQNVPNLDHYFVIKSIIELIIEALF
jgi:hypothetical protein